MKYLRFCLDEIPEIQKIGVYGIHNKTKNKYYIGSTNNIYHRFCLYFRWFNDGCGINKKMDEDYTSNACRDDFEIIIFEIFEDGVITIDDLRKKERQYIERYDAIKNGYNTDLPHNGNIPMGTILKSKDYMTERRKNCFKGFISSERKERYKLHAARRGYKSLTALIVDLLENDIKSNPLD